MKYAFRIYFGILKICLFFRCRNIFAVQQCLTNITRSRESDLDAARQYYELLYLPADVSKRKLEIHKTGQKKLLYVSKAPPESL